MCAANRNKTIFVRNLRKLPQKHNCCNYITAYLCGYGFVSVIVFAIEFGKFSKLQICSKIYIIKLYTRCVWCCQTNSSASIDNSYTTKATNSAYMTQLIYRNCGNCMSTNNSSGCNINCIVVVVRHG